MIRESAFKWSASIKRKKSVAMSACIHLSRPNPTKGARAGLHVLEHGDHGEAGLIRASRHRVKKLSRAQAESPQCGIAEATRYLECAEEDLPLGCDKHTCLAA